METVVYLSLVAQFSLSVSLDQRRRKIERKCQTRQTRKPWAAKYNFHAYSSVQYESCELASSQTRQFATLEPFPARNVPNSDLLIFHFQSSSVFGKFVIRILGQFSKFVGICSHSVSELESESEPELQSNSANHSISI